MDPELEEASRTGNLDALSQLLQKDGLLLDRLTTMLFLTDTPVHIASLFGHADFIREILNRRPELARDLNGQGLSPLHLASAKGYLSVVKELLKVGSELCRIVDKDGLMPIHIAAVKGRTDVLRKLSDACPESIQAVTSYGDTVLHLAVRSNCYEAVEFLVEKMNEGEILNRKDAKGNTMLHLAIARKQFQVTKFLLGKQEIDVNFLNLKGCTPLDVLFDSPHEYGDFVLEEIIRAAGGKTAGEIVYQSPAEIEHVLRDDPVVPPRSNSRFIHCIKKLFHPRRRRSKTGRSKQFIEGDNKTTPGIKTLMVVAILIATITFQAGLSPPDAYKKNIKTSSPSPSPSAQDTMSIRHTTFLIFNMVGLFASLSIILLFICIVPEKKKVVMKFLIWFLWLAVFSTAMAFSVAILDVFPDSDHNIVPIFAKGCFLILSVTTIWVCFKLVKHLRKVFAHIAKRIVFAVLMIIAVFATLFINFVISIIAFAWFQG